MNRTFASKEFGWLVLAGILLSLVLGGAVTVLPSLVILALFACAVVIATWFLPEYVLAIVLVLTLAGGEFGYLASAGYPMSAVAGVASLFFLLGRKEVGPDVKRLLLPLLLIAIMALRYLLEDDLGSVTTVVRLAGIIFLTYFSMCKQRNVVHAVTFAAIVFIAVTVIMGDFNNAGIRYSGISGNPNRMVYALSILFPFLLVSFRRSQYKTFRFVMILFMIAVVTLLFMSQSSQAIVVLMAIAIGLIWASIYSRTPVLKYIAVTAGILLTIVFYVYALPSIKITEDLSTLSGRTTLYEVAWIEFAEQPLFGTGERHVSAGSVLDKSAHSSLLGLLAYGGILAGVPWLLILIRALYAGFKRLNSGDLLGLAPVVLVVLQTVQSIEFIAPTWFIITYFSFQFVSYNRKLKEGRFLEQANNVALRGERGASR